MKTFSWIVAVVLSLGVGILTFGASAFIQARGAVTVAPAPPITTTTTAAPLGAGVSYEASGMPVRLIIPAIGVDANIQSVGMWWRVPTDMGIPTNLTDVGWYNLGPRPGEPGSAVIDGHLDGATVKQAVFYNLGKLQPGDSVEVVESGGKTLQFKVVATKLYDYNAPTTDIFNSDTSKARLNLITCAGDWIKGQGQYNQRIVVFTELVS